MNLATVIFAFCTSIVPNKNEEKMLTCFDHMVNCTIKATKTSQKDVEACMAKTKKVDLTKPYEVK